MAGAAGVIILMMSFILPGTTQRYAADFMTLLTILALMAWMVFLSRTRRGSWRHRIVAGGGLLLVAWGSAVGLAMGLVGYENRLELNRPALFHRLEDIFSPVSVLQTRVAGRPVIGNIISPYNQFALRKVAWGSLRQGGDLDFDVTAAPAIVTLVAPREATYHLRVVAGIGRNGIAGVPTVMNVQVGKFRGEIAVGKSQRFDLPVRLKAGITRTVWTAAAERSTGELLVYVEEVSIEGPDS
jgi:hypothetical protein